MKTPGWSDMGRMRWGARADGQRIAANRVKLPRAQRFGIPAYFRNTKLHPQAFFDLCHISLGECEVGVSAVKREVNEHARFSGCGTNQVVLRGQGDEDVVDGVCENPTRLSSSLERLPVSKKWR